jgi:hypothetical protein
MKSDTAALPEVTVLAGSERLVITGRAASIIGLVAQHAARINATPVGRFIAHFAEGQLKPELQESLPALRLDR